MSDPLRTDGSRAHDAESGSNRDAKIEQLLLTGLDHYFAGSYELAINVWTRALFLDRSHARARAYIERARSALAERQRESEEILQNGVAAFQRGDGDEARRLLQTAIDRGAPSEEALAVLERMNRLETAVSANAPRSDRASRSPEPRAPDGSSRRRGGMVAFMLAGGALAAAVAFAVSTDRIDWRSLVALARTAGRVTAPAATSLAPVPRESTLPLPRHGETLLGRARALTASGHLHDALTTLESVRSTDAQKADADRLRAEIQRQLLALTPLPEPIAPGPEKGDRRP